MKITTLLLIASTAVALASNPLVEIIDDTAPSQDIPNATLTNKYGQKGLIHFRTFGTDRIEAARRYGQSVSSDPNKERLVRQKAADLYPGDPFFQKAFRQYAI